MAGFIGSNLLEALLELNQNVVGVDNFSEFDGKTSEFLFYEKFNKIKKNNHNFFKEDALTYLKNCNKKFDFYFYDALHTFEYQYEALNLATPHLKKGALIMIDDICWNYSNDPIEATNKFLKDNKKDYKLLLDIKTKYNKHPTFWNGYFIIEKI